jgi:hypothetical protein
MIKAKLKDASMLIDNKLDYIAVEGYETNFSEERHYVRLKVALRDFVPHDLSYYNKVLQAAYKLLSRI